MELSDIKGLGPKRIELLSQLHIHSCDDLVQFFPHEYLNYTQTSPISSVADGQVATLRVKIVSEPTIFYAKGKYIVSARAEDDTGRITLRWMNQPYRQKQVVCGTTYFAHGRISKKRGTVLYNPHLEQQSLGIVPVYSLPKGLTQACVRSAIGAVLERMKPFDRLPLELTERYDLLPYAEAIHEIHFPTETDRLMRAKYRLQFEQTLLYFTAVYLFRQETKLQNGYAFRTEGILDRFCAKLPFTPTDAQLRVMREVEADLASRVPMNRLIQGDVGSGKTIIAEYALAVAAACGKQGVLLVPTEILAEQHYRSLQAMFNGTVCLYTGSLSKKERAEALTRIQSKEALVTVGTHALLTDSVCFSDLGLVVTDEQHRFGVEQRAKMEAKGIRPDVLVMSATPIPRTLALMLYADLSLSVVNELPKGRKPVQTMYVPKTRREAMYRYIAERMQKDERAFVVCPLIDETEGFEGLSATELYAELKKLLPTCPIGLLHGRMRDEEKSAAMEAFRSGAVRILVSTTVIEVGVDVPNATYMIVEGADHFGLATLHQLRGRVGRSDLPSFCYLLSEHATENARERIQTMIQSNDGFYLAQKDMEMRGYGDLFGVRQSGEGEIASFLRNCTVELLETCAAAANEILQTPSVVNNELLAYALERYGAATRIARN